MGVPDKPGINRLIVLKKMSAPSFRLLDDEFFSVVLDGNIACVELIAHIIYVNGAYENADNAVGKLMHDFRCPEPEKFNYDVLAESVKDCKESDKEARKMSKLMEELATELAQEMAVDMAQEMAGEMAQEMEGEMTNEKVNSERKEIAVSFIRDGELSLETIAKCAKLPLDTVRQLAQELPASV